MSRVVIHRLIEMPLTGREDSYKPAKLAHKLLPFHSRDDEARTRLDYAPHVALEAMWGAVRVRWQQH